MNGADLKASFTFEVRDALKEATSLIARAAMDKFVAPSARSPPSSARPCDLEDCTMSALDEVDEKEQVDAKNCPSD